MLEKHVLDIDSPIVVVVLDIYQQLPLRILGDGPARPLVLQGNQFVEVKLADQHV